MVHASVLPLAMSMLVATMFAQLELNQSYHVSHMRVTHVHVRWR